MTQYISTIGWVFLPFITGYVISGYGYRKGWREGRKFEKTMRTSVMTTRQAATIKLPWCERCGHDETCGFGRCTFVAKPETATPNAE